MKKMGREFVLTTTIMIMIWRVKDMCECCVESERNGLLQIKSHFSPFSPKILSSWGTSNAECCTWERVECNPTTRKITGLDLSAINDNDLADPWYLNASLFLPFRHLDRLDLQSNNIAGCIHNEGFERLSTLTELEILFLSFNNFNRSILRSLSGLWSLKSLYMPYNKLNGTIDTAELKGLSNLQDLDLSGNQISNFVVSKEFNNLEFLELNFNQLNQTTTEILLQSIGRMTSLKTLSMASCGLNGNIPGLCNLKHLVDLDMSYNDLNGKIPRCMGNLTSLEYLALSGNKFTGKISLSPLPRLTSLQYLLLSHNLFEIPMSLAPLFNLSRLKVLDARNNTVYADTEDGNSKPEFQLEVLSLNGYGDGGALPNFLYHQNNLQKLVISNINLRGRFPYWLLHNNTRLVILDLSNNSLSGNLQLPYRPCVNLTDLDISNNFLSGSIPSEIGVFFPSLVYLDMSENGLRSGISDSLCQSTALRFFDASLNNISGTLPKCIANMSQLEILDLSYNNIYGDLPSNFSSSSLRIVNLSKNRLHGSLKDAFDSCVALSVLNLSHNNFSGIVPSWIGKLSDLIILVMGYNNFQGKIPIELCKLKQLSFMDFSHNSLVGNILPCLNFTSYWSRGEFISMKLKNIEITMKGRAYMYEEKVLRYVSGLDMSCNYFTGNIPVEIGNLRSIISLNLSHNHLTGSIPQTFSNLNQIQSLDLSNNNLQGPIPPQLTQLTALAVFNVSFNNLSGKVPNPVAQFATFDESSYKGNPFLYGWLLPKNFTEPDSSQLEATTSPDDDESSKRFAEMEEFFASFCVAYATVLFTLVVVLCINPHWRRVWFYYVQMSIDKMNNFVTAT